MVNDWLRLEVVASRFAEWRAKKAGSDRVPDELWASAVEAAQVHGTTATARRLGLNHSILKRRIEGDNATTQQFVELPLNRLVETAIETESVVEVEDGAGFRMRLLLRGATPVEVATAARGLWSARG